MRYQAAVLVLALGVQPVVAQNLMHRSVANIVEADKWSVATGIHNGSPLVVRYRDGFESHPNVAAFPRRLTITWTYKPDATGMPTQESGDAMATFEDRLIPALEHDLSAVLTAVITNAGMRQWILYTGSASECTNRINSIAQQKTRYPIAIEIENDANWTFLYESILDGMRK
jgi:hypothetical protein